MLFSIAATLLFLSIFASVVFTGFLGNFAKARNVLIDIPNKSRNFHFRPTPLIGGISIHAAMLFSMLIMLFLIDYKYDFRLDGFGISEQQEAQRLSEVGYSKQLSIKGKEGQNLENYRINLKTQDDSLTESPSYEVSIGSSPKNQLKITQLTEDTFKVLLPNGESKSFQTTESGIVEINLSGEPLSPPINVSNKSTNFFSFSSFTSAFIIISILLQGFTLLDDAFGMRPLTRLFAQGAATLLVIIFGNIFIESLQISILGVNLQLGYWGIPFTIFAVVGIINAFNLIDGINGLCASFALISMGSLQIASGFDVANYSLVIAMGSILGFLLYNLGFLGTKRRVFLGDNGSTFLGFLVAWTCINYSQTEIGLIKPVTCLWIVAIPLLDCIGVIIGRVMQGIFPFSPGRDHIHHKLQAYTGSSFKTLILLTALGLFFAATGVAVEMLTKSSAISLILFFGFAACYYLGIYLLTRPTT